MNNNLTQKVGHVAFILGLIMTLGLLISGALMGITLLISFLIAGDIAVVEALTLNIYDRTFWFVEPIMLVSYLGIFGGSIGPLLLIVGWVINILNKK